MRSLRSLRPTHHSYYMSHLKGSKSFRMLYGSIFQQCVVRDEGTHRAVLGELKNGDPNTEKNPHFGTREMHVKQGLVDIFILLHLVAE